MRIMNLQMKVLYFKQLEISYFHKKIIIEILDYAKFLGMDPYEDRDLFYIAREGLKAPLPHPWRPC